jgi:hypothetical protein
MMFRDELSKPRRCRRAEHLAGWAVLLHHPFVEKDHAGRDVPSKTHLVRDHEHGAAFVGEGPHDAQDLPDEFRIERSNNISFGFIARARAIAARCCWPPERCAG